MARNKLSKAARASCAAAGRANLANWRNRRTEVARERAALAAEFRAELLAELGPNPSATARALIESAVSAYTAIAVAQNRFIQGRTNAESMEALIRLQGALSRTLRLLGVRLPSASAPPGGDLASYLATKKEVVTPNDNTTGNG